MEMHSPEVEEIVDHDLVDEERPVGGTTTLEKMDEDDELWQMKARLRAEHPNGLLFIRQDGTVTNEPWVLLDITPHVEELSDGTSHTVHYVRLRRQFGEGDIEEFPLGDFMEKRLLKDAPR